MGADAPHPCETNSLQASTAIVAGSLRLPHDRGRIGTGWLLDLLYRWGTIPYSFSPSIGHLEPASPRFLRVHMLRSRKKRLAVEDARAARLLSEIELSIRQLEDEDLLDMADIFRDEQRGPLAGIAASEMAKRNISL